MIGQAGYVSVQTGYSIALFDCDIGSTEGDTGHEATLETHDVDMEQGGGDPVDPQSSSGGTGASSDDDDGKFFSPLKSKH